MCTLPPPPFPLDDSAQSLSARRAAESLARAATGERKVHFAPRTVAPRKIRICRWALALPLRHCTWERGLRRGGKRCFCCCRLLLLLTPRPVPLTLSLAFFPTVGGSPILLAGTPASPATSGRAALRAAVPGLGMGGTKVLLASLEEARSLPRPTCPLTGPSLAASLMRAQGSCELPTAKPRTRSILPPLRGAFLDQPSYWSPPPSKFTTISPGVQATHVRHQPTGTHGLQTGDTVAGRLVPSDLVADNRGRIEDEIHVSGPAWKCGARGQRRTCGHVFTHTSSLWHCVYLIHNSLIGEQPPRQTGFVSSSLAWVHRLDWFVVNLYRLNSFLLEAVR